jgi:hypothetical protein
MQALVPVVGDAGLPLGQLVGDELLDVLAPEPRAVTGRPAASQKAARSRTASE